MHLLVLSQVLPGIKLRHLLSLRLRSVQSRLREIARFGGSLIGGIHDLLFGAVPISLFEVDCQFPPDLRRVIDIRLRRHVFGGRVPIFAALDAAGAARGLAIG